VAAADGFEIIAERTVASAGFLEIHALDMRAPDGSVTERIAVRHPGAVGVVALDEGDVILIRQYRAAIGRALLEIPAGKLDVAGEPPIATARRELEEEIGMRPAVVEPILGFYTTPGFTNEHIELFLASDLTPVPHTPHGPEETAAEIVRVPLAGLAGLLASGEVLDVKTLVGLQWLLLRP
jgi:ADP-ribose pyrophosphatase